MPGITGIMPAMNDTTCRRIFVNLEPVSFETASLCAAMEGTSVADQGCRPSVDMLGHRPGSSSSSFRADDTPVTDCLVDEALFYTHQQQCQLTIVEKALEAAFGSCIAPIHHEEASDFGRYAGNAIIAAAFPGYGERLALIITERPGLPTAIAATEVDRAHQRAIEVLVAAGLLADICVEIDGKEIPLAQVTSRYAATSGPDKKGGEN